MEIDTSTQNLSIIQNQQIECMSGIIRLHDYQIDIIRRLHEEWRSSRSVMLQMPTGTGKTHVLAAVVKEFLDGGGGCVWIVAHRRELVAQVRDTAARFGMDGADGRVRVMSVQWLARHRDDTGEEPGLVVIDEAHHALAETYRTLWDRCPGARFLGLTATPCRMGHEGFTGLFDALVRSWTVAEFIEKGWLSAFDYVSIRAGSSEQRLIDSLERRGADGDFQVKEMDALLNRRPSIERLYRSVRRFADGRKGIVYAVSIDHARRIAEYYCEKGIRAVAIDSRTPAEERKSKVGLFKKGEIEVLVNVDVFSEGFDCPDVEFVQMARPTLSLAKYLQQVGRGLRKAEGKSACTLIDNVGLYRIFGLPTEERDWDSMFRGDMSGKGVCPKRTGHGCMAAEVSAEEDSADCDMEVIVSHDSLLSAIAERRRRRTPSAEPPELKAWQDADTGLWGLRLGRRRTSGAVFAAVLDMRYGMAAVRYGDGTCGLVGSCGEDVWRGGYSLSLKFSHGHFLRIQTRDGGCRFMDLYSLRIYDERPRVRRFGSTELLSVGRTCYSRTRHVYENSQGIGGDSVSRHKFYTAIFDRRMPAPYRAGESSGTDGYRCGYACLLDGDHEDYYWIFRWLADGGIIINDDRGRYYHAAEGREKIYVGCTGSVEEAERCFAEIERMTERANEIHRATKKKEEEKLRTLGGTGEACPFRSGMKWGLKVGGRVTVPPVYRSMKPPVGGYCAVEKNFGQWGVIALDGTPVVEPRYPDVEISAQGTATVTKVTGSRVAIELP